MSNQDSINLEDFAFVFESKRKPYKTRVVGCEEAGGFTASKKWHHTATINPEIWIEYLLNNPLQQDRQIEGLKYKPK